MLLRAAIVTLLVLNLGVAAWWIAGGNAAPERRHEALPAAAPSLRLLREAGTTPVAESAETTPAGPGVATEAAPVGQGLCLRFGPFDDAAARDAARPALTAASDQMVPRDLPAGASRGWKVHIPPFATRDEARAMGERIKAAGITDWYLLNEGADANGIALGRYASEDAARRREAELAAKGIPAQAAPLGDLSMQWWLDARLRPEADLASLVGVGPSKRIDCATLR